MNGVPSCVPRCASRPRLTLETDVREWRAELQSALTLVVWIGCLAVGVLGLVIPYPRLPPAPPRPTAPQTQIVEVEVAPIPQPTGEAKSVAMVLPAPTPVAVRRAIAPGAALTKVAEPVPAIAFPVPVESGPETVDTDVDTPVRGSGLGDPAPPAPPVRSLILGQGEGNQPAPEYPRMAIRSGQEGTVRIGLSVSRDGKVVSAEVVAASPWPLLNEAALRAVRRLWRFKPGDVRRYEVSIAFRIDK